MENDDIYYEFDANNNAFSEHIVAENENVLIPEPEVNENIINPGPEVNEIIFNPEQQVAENENIINPESEIEDNEEIFNVVPDIDAIMFGANVYYENAWLFCE